MKNKYRGPRFLDCLEEDGELEEIRAIAEEEIRFELSEKRLKSLYQNGLLGAFILILILI